MNSFMDRNRRMLTLQEAVELVMESDDEDYQIAILPPEEDEHHTDEEHIGETATVL